MELHEFIYEFATLILVACSVSLVTKWIRIPYTVALVLAGLLIGFFSILPPIPLTKDLVFLIFLPPLLFEGSLNIDISELKENFREISYLSIFGVLLSTVFIGYMLNFLLAIPLSLALLFGAMISPTDPVSVLATFRETSVPKKISTILEGESIFNDGIAIVIFSILLENYANLNLINSIIEFVLTCFGGALLGFALGYLAYKILSFIEDYMLEVTITLLLAYGSFLIAESIGVSGVIAVVISGLIIGNYGRFFSMSPTTRLALSNFWNVVVFIINSAIFILVGLDAKFGVYPEIVETIIITFSLMLLARFITVLPLFLKTPLTQTVFIFWGGLRGAIPLTLALSLIESKQLFISLAFGVVLISLVFQGLTLEFFAIKKFPKKERKAYYHLAKLLATRNAIIELKKSLERGEIPKFIAEEIINELSKEVDSVEKKILLIDDEEKAEFYEKAIKIALNAKKAAIINASFRGLIPKEVGDKLIKEFDEELSV